jgi:hypothetical protein
MLWIPKFNLAAVLLAICVLASAAQAGENFATSRIAVAWRNPETGKYSTISITGEQLNKIETMRKSGMSSEAALESIVARHKLAASIAKR